MNNDEPILFIEINEINFIFAAGVYNNDNLEVVEKITAPHIGIDKNKFIDIFKASETLKNNIKKIEDKLDCIFKDVTVILDNFDCTCINVSGFKKLNGSQVLKENISYILNSLKSAVSDNEKDKSILHIFNSRSILDGNNIENLPIGLFGNFYSHELTFLLIGNNDLKNIKQIFNKNNLEVKKIILKKFCEGVKLINQNNIETFYKIKINHDTCNIIFFDQASFKYSENFNFGTDIIFKDIKKICSIDNDLIINFFNNGFDKDKKFSDNQLLEEKYFSKGSYRKIRKNLIIDIVKARIDEIVNIILHKNINIQKFNKEKIKIYITFQDITVSNNFYEYFESYLNKNTNFETNLIADFETNSLVSNIANLSIYGWRKEAIPIVQIKNSLITRIFKSIFG
jgi:cell division protein FtsA